MHRLAPGWFERHAVLALEHFDLEVGREQAVDLGALDGMRRPELTAFKRRMLDAHEQHPAPRPHKSLQNRGVGLPI